MATILVFMELTLQFNGLSILILHLISHNPCFYGINFAILVALGKPLV